MSNNTPLTRKDFVSQVEPRWCLGCGCYGIFKCLTGVFAELGIPRENYAMISGIGCSSRFPYYVNTFGFHTLHGRAPTVAMGLKLYRPELNTWVLTGDGDGLSIGGNHFIHLMRRNADIKVILFNNQIYGLTKGQASPTTAAGTKTKTTPGGVTETPMKPATMALAAGATYVARVIANDQEMLQEALMGAAKHKGIAFVEVMMNCVIFNEQAFEQITSRESRAETTIRLRHGQPIVYGAEKNKAICLNGSSIETRAAGDASVLTHDIHSPNSHIAYLLSQMDAPLPLGILRQVEAPVFTDKAAQNVLTPSFKSEAELSKVLQGSNAWIREKNGEIHTAQ